MQSTDQDEQAKQRTLACSSVTQPFSALYLPNTVPSFFTRNFAKFQEIGLVSPLPACSFDSLSEKNLFFITGFMMGHDECV